MDLLIQWLVMVFKYVTCDLIEIYVASSIGIKWKTIKYWTNK